MWQYIKNANINGAHDSLVDTKAQTDILIHKYFVPFINRAKSIKMVEDIFAKSEQVKWKKEMEHLHEVHTPWKEKTVGDSVV